MRRILPCLALVLAAALPAAAATPQGVAVLPQGLFLLNPSSITVSIPLPGALATEVSLSFENVTGLNLFSLGLSAQLANPLDPAFRARFPSGTVLSALPIVLRIEPPVWGGLSFRGVASFDIHTHVLSYVPATPLRIFSAPLGGPFRDITAGMGSGSYRARSTMGGFSEFVIVLDLRPVDQVIETKLDALDALLETYEASMPGSVYDDLEELLAATRTSIANEELEEALDTIDEFLEEVEDHSGGTGIPNVWRAARDRNNVAGYLRGGAATLRFSVALKDALSH
jgi:hypothetical protein